MDTNDLYKEYKEFKLALECNAYDSVIKYLRKTNNEVALHCLDNEKDFKGETLKLNNMEDEFEWFVNSYLCFDYLDTTENFINYINNKPVYYCINYVSDNNDYIKSNLNGSFIQVEADVIKEFKQDHSSINDMIFDVDYCEIDNDFSYGIEILVKQKPANERFMDKL